MTPRAAGPQTGGAGLLNPELLAVAFLLITVAAAAHAITGFGFVLVAVPLFTLLTGPRTAVVACTTLGLLLTSLGWFEDRSSVQWRPVLTISSGAILGIPLGLLVFTSVTERTLQLIIGTVVLSFTGLLLLRLQVPRGLSTQFAAGALSGGMLATTGMNGPPMVLALQAANMSPPAFRATLQTAFTLQSLVVVSGLALTRQFSVTSLSLIALGAPALWAGWRIGDQCFRRLSPSHIRRLVMLTLVVAGSLTMASGLTNG